MKYVVDASEFKGYVITSMSDNIHSDYGGETLEELKVRENNPNLIAISPKEVDKLLNRHLQELIDKPFEEITKERYYDMFECLPPERMGRNWFFLGEPYSYDLFHFCFTVYGRYFMGLRRIGTPNEELYKDISQHVQKLHSHEG